MQPASFKPRWIAKLLACFIPLSLEIEIRNLNRKEDKASGNARYLLQGFRLRVESDPTTVTYRKVIPC